MSIIRHHQPGITRVFPHNGNDRAVITNHRNSSIAPSNTSPPGIDRAVAAQVSTCDPGQWAGRPRPTIQYQWQLDAADLPGEVYQTYTPTLPQVASTLSCVVTATNVAGTASQSSAALPVQSSVAVTSGPFLDEKSGVVFWVRSDRRIGFNIDDDASPDIWTEERPEGLSKAAWKRMLAKLKEELP